MTRKLSATQIIAGARAYSHNASRRAHQLSGPKRVRVMHGPVGNAALNDGIDSSCEHCGYQLCNCGPCATCGEVPYYCSGTHAYEPPKPSARALDNLGAEPARVWRVGDRVRVSLNLYEVLAVSAAGLPRRVKVIESCGSTALAGLVHDEHNGSWANTKWERVEPAPSPVSEAPTAESEWVPPKGWKQLMPGDDPTHWVHFGPPHVSVYRFRGQWVAIAQPSYMGDAPPTLAQACCAALSIEVYDVGGGEWRACMTGGLPGGVLAHGCTSAEQVARAALEAWSRREPAQ